MNEHNTQTLPREEALPDGPGRAQWYAAKNGVFRTWDKEAQEAIETDRLSGFVTECRVTHDPGKPDKKIAPVDKLLVRLEHPDSGVRCVSIGLNSKIALSNLVGALANHDPGTPVLLRAREAGMKGTAIDVYRASGSAWEKVRGADLGDSLEARYEGAVSLIEKLPNYRPCWSILQDVARSNGFAGPDDDAAAWNAWLKKTKIADKVADLTPEQVRLVVDMVKDGEADLPAAPREETPARAVHPLGETVTDPDMEDEEDLFS